MPVRATKRGAARVPFPAGADADVLICGASFAGLTVARELRATGARVLILDRYEIGERQTSACAAPTEWLRNLGLEASIRQTFDSLLVHTPDVGEGPLGAARSPSRRSTIRSSAGCCGTRAAPPSSRPRRSPQRTNSTVSTDRGDVTAPLIVDALGWRRVLGAGENVQPPEARALARPGGPPARHRRRPRAVDRPALRRRRLRLGVPRARRGAHRRRLLRPARSGQAADAAAGRGRRPAAGRLPGQLDPAPHPPRGRGRDLLRRRQRGPLPAADRRGHPDGVLLRDRRSGASCAPCSRAARTRPTRSQRYGAFSASHKLEVRVDVRRPAVDPAPARPAAGQRDARSSRARA